MSYNANKSAVAKRDSLKCNTLNKTKRDSIGSNGSGSSSANLNSPDSKRRESLVKPTWQNIGPGQVPVVTLERLRKMSSHDDDQQQQQQKQPQQQQHYQKHYQQHQHQQKQPNQQQYQRQSSIVVVKDGGDGGGSSREGNRSQGNVTNSRRVSSTTLIKGTAPQTDEVFDVFGKVIR